MISPQLVFSNKRSIYYVSPGIIDVIGLWKKLLTITKRTGKNSSILSGAFEKIFEILTNFGIIFVATIAEIIPNLRLEKMIRMIAE